MKRMPTRQTSNHDPASVHASFAFSAWRLQRVLRGVCSQNHETKAKSKSITRGMIRCDFNKICRNENQLRNCLRFGLICEVWFCLEAASPVRFVKIAAFTLSRRRLKLRKDSPSCNFGISNCTRRGGNFLSKQNELER